jgi:hypothetical protein
MPLPAMEGHFLDPLTLGLDVPRIEERSCHFDSHIEDKAQAQEHIVQVLAATAEVVGVEDNVPYHQTLPSAAVAADLLIYTTGNACPVDRGSCLDRCLEDRNTRMAS